MTKSARYVGIGCVIIGVLAALGIYISDAPNWLVFHPLILISIGVGIALLFLWKAEDTIEKRKDEEEK